MDTPLDLAFAALADPTSIGIALLLFGPVEPFQHILEGKSRHLLAQFGRGLVFGVEKVGVATSGLLPLAFVIIATSIIATLCSLSWLIFLREVESVTLDPLVFSISS